MVSISLSFDAHPDLDIHHSSIELVRDREFYTQTDRPTDRKVSFSSSKYLFYTPLPLSFDAHPDRDIHHRSMRHACIPVSYMRASRVRHSTPAHWVSTRHRRPSPETAGPNWWTHAPLVNDTRRWRRTCRRDACRRPRRHAVVQNPARRQAPFELAVHRWRHAMAQRP